MMKNIMGMTLIELLIALMIVGILAALSSAAYFNHVYRARRMDAIQTLYAMQLAEEHYRSNNAQYGTLAQVWNSVATTSNGYYSLAISNVSATTYTLTATALLSQANDKENSTSCTPLTLTLSAGTTTQSPASCWLTS